MLKTYLDYPVEVEENNPEGPLLFVLLHGFGASTFSWHPVTEALAARGHVIAYDRPGFGVTPLVSRSAKRIDPYSLQGQVELLGAIIEKEAKGRPVVLIGHSAGALVATEFVLRQENVAAGLILESPAVWRRPPIPSLVARLLRLPALESFGQRLLESFEKAGMRILESSYFDRDKLTAETIAGYRAPMNSPDWKLSLWRFMTADQSNKVRTNLWRLELPVFVLTGDHDKIVKVEDTLKVTERIAGHSIYLVPEAGHLAHEEQPDDFMRVVDRFIAKVVA